MHNCSANTKLDHRAIKRYKNDDPFVVTGSKIILKSKDNVCNTKKII